MTPAGGPPYGFDAAAREPDVFTQMPLKKTVEVQGLRYLTEPLAQDVTVVGPISLTLHAAIDQSDTNWIVILKDIGPDALVIGDPGEGDAVPEEAGGNGRGAAAGSALADAMTMVRGGPKL